MFLDIQVNGGSGLLFNDIKNLDEFLKIELNQLKYGKTFIVPTFITDSNEKLKNFVKIVLERIKLNEKEFIINNSKIILPKLFGVHFEGPFITNKGTHPLQYLKEFNKDNLDEFIEIIKPLSGKLSIYFTFAPELLKNTELLKYLKSEIKNITISAGHTKITENEFKTLQENLGNDKIKMLTHFHNAMLEGHFIDDVYGMPSYVMNNGFDGYFGMVADGYHTSKGELLPMLINYYDNLCIVSDGAAPACYQFSKNNILFEMGGNVSVVETKENELPSYFWTDFSKNKDFKEKDLNKVFELYIKGEGGYKTLAGSAINISQSYNFLQHLDIKKELEKTKSNKKAKKLLEYGLQKHNLKENQIQEFINQHLDKMFFENPIKALNIDKDIYNYTFKDNKLFKNNKVFIDFDGDFGIFLEQETPNQKELKNKLINNLKTIIK